MKKLLFVLLASFVSAIATDAQTVNLTPWPKSMNVKTGQYALPATISINATGLSDEVMTDVQDFAATLRTTTGRTVTVDNNEEAAITLMLNTSKLNDEGYIITVTATGVTLKASAPEGFFYGMQTLKKMLPANVMAGKLDASAEYVLPLLTINDAPRFAYRGFMLDVSRHFFTVDEIKKMLRLMACYKMNHFHWHLTDDQGWRVEVKKYPKLTTIGATRSNSFNTDLKYGQYWTNAQYGPYFYTQDEIRDVVAYAAKLHITVVPEIEVPGHLAAAMAAYPEFSCNPNGSHNVWISGGISTDVLNVANEGAVQFVKDILSEIAPLFPSEIFHIGGDETPTTAWQNNAECQALYAAERMTNYSQLQSRFTKIIAEHLRTLGKRIAVWNEAITANGANTQLIKDSEATVFCWTPCQSAASKAANLGLKAIITEYNSGGQSYYINRKPTGNDYGAGYGDNTLQNTYNYVPVPTNVSSALEPYYYGVQGTFWCEHVSEPEHLEYLALPRLMAVAEAGWTPQARKDWTSFRNRMRQDTTMLKLGGYNYHPQFLKYDGATPDASSSTDNVMPQSSTGLEAANKYWYKIVSKGVQRDNRQIELIENGATLLHEQSGNGAAVGMLWGNVAAEERAGNYNAQLWAFELDPGGSGKYALVNKTAPNGSVNPTASAANTGGRWSYDTSKKNYNFILADNGYGTEGSNYYYSIRSDKHSGLWMNCAMPAKGFAINLYNNPADGNGGLWTFVPTFEAETSISDLQAEATVILSKAQTYEDESQRAPGLFSYEAIDALEDLVANPSGSTREQWQAALDSVKASFVFPELNGTYRVTNTVERFADRSLCDVKGATYLTHTNNPYSSDAWTVTSFGNRDGLTVKIRLKNMGTARFVGTPAGSATGNLGNLVGTSSTVLTLTYVPAEGDFTITGNNMLYYPVSITAPSNAGTVAASSGAIRPQGTGWKFIPVKALTLICTNEADRSTLASYTCSRTEEELADPLAQPAIRGFSYIGQENVDANTIRLLYRRTSYNVDIIGRDPHGAIVVEQFGQQNVDACGTYCPTVPEIPFYTPQTTTIDCGERPCQDTVYNIVYNTDAFAGVLRLGQAVSKLEDGHSYIFYDTSPNATERIGYRNINPNTGQIMQATAIEDTDPYYVWTLERVGTTGNKFRVKNEMTGKYIPQLTKSDKIYVGNTGDTFTFTRHDGDVWEIWGTNNLCWDGVAGSFTGWTAYGHPYKIYEYYTQPYYLVTVEYVYENGDAARPAVTALVKAGDEYTITAPTIEGHAVKTVENAEAMAYVSSHATARVIYTDETTGITGSLATTANGSSTIYDLQGRRVLRPARGLYIIGGAKVLLK